MNRGSEARVTVPAWRRWLVTVALLALPMTLLGQAVTIQLVDSDFLQGQGDQRHLRTEVLPAHRGAIHDRQGEALAISAPVDSVWADPGVLLDESGAEGVGQLAEALSLDAAALRDDLEAREDREFVYIRRHVNPSLAETVMALELPGVALQREYRRFYPAGEVTGHVLGFTNIDDQGQEGLERVYDDWLSGEPGAKRVLRDRRRRNIEDVERLREPDAGRDLTLTIDRRLQYVAYRELKAAVEREQAAGGSVVLMDPASGEILAMVNQPAFNPNRRSEISAGRYRNRAVTDTHEPGSVMKPFTVAAALASGRYQPDTSIDTSPGTLRVGRSQVQDVRNFGELTVATVLKKSSNVGAATLALDLEQGQIWSLLDRMQFGQPTGLVFPGEASGYLSASASERPIERATLAFGYGVSVSALQLARAYSAIAADGDLPTPTLVSGAEAGDPVSVMDPEIAGVLRRMLTEVTREGGTATQAAIPGYQVAGKTGTSRKAIAGGYAEDRYLSIFAGMAPADDPRFVAVVSLDEPSGDQYYAGPVAGPVFRSVMESALRLYNVPPDDTMDGETLTAAREVRQ
ncbi:peptidoglycan D,D-transpeptidase FtsI family protein [Spiribacter salinus]|jgi:cell division protein FtsI (penicillin-binding protein 3)|uniref:peptidoglycan D,D-transpeptidase FtsI family protein n=1 Tax=Spiribacter salinus TaxID=1335746 RepID=UPI001C9490BA|nr:penicillin-binding protein 2 [Spiribacter salinus]MBY5269056.1 cell division protein [Spiribacter salinus]